MSIFCLAADTVSLDSWLNVFNILILRTSHTYIIYIQEVLTRMHKSISTNKMRYILFHESAVYERGT